MKKTVGIFSLVVMLLTQVFSPFAYATSGDLEEDEETPVVIETENESLVTEEETNNVQSQEVELLVDTENLENSVGGGNQFSGNNNELQTEKSDVLTQIQPESQTGAIIGDNIKSGDVKVLSGTDENLKEENEVLSGSKEGSGFIETIKNFFGMGDIEEKNEDKGFESQEIYGTREYEGVRVEVYATTGLFESGVYLTIDPIIEELDQVKEVLMSGDVEIPEEKEEQTVVAFDITFRNPVTKEEVQPKDGTVQVTFNYKENESLKEAEEDEEQEVKVYHLNDIDEKGEKIEEITGAKVEEIVVNKSKNEEDNIIVIDAESFSIYAVIKSNLSENITIKYNANGGKFKSGNSEVNELSVTYTKQDGVYKPSINVQAPYRESKDMNAQSGWMFAGWYTTSSNQTIEWLGKVSDTTTNNITVYAKRLPFNDLILNVGGQKIILMDRNMGAEGVASGNYYPDGGHEDDSVLGFYYQWGNNYGFKSTGDVNTYWLGSNSGPDITNYGPGNFYSDSTYYLRASGNYTSWYSRSGNGIINLWGGNNGQGPCPEGYYIPGYWERGDILGYVKNEMTNNQEFCSGIESSGECFSRKLKLPHSGTRDKASANPIQKGYFSSYWSSEAYGNDAGYRIFYADTMPSYADSVSNRYASNVRCFRKKMRVRFVNDGEVIQTNYIDKDTSLTDILKPANPTKEGLFFAGWFNGDEKFSFSKKITEDITLTAKFTDHYYTISFDTDGGSEKDDIVVPGGVSQKMYLSDILYSHTENLTDDGIKTTNNYGNSAGNYGNNWNNSNIRGTDRTSASSNAHVLTIPGSEKLLIDLYYNGESTSYDWVSIWKGSYPSYTASSNTTSIGYITTNEGANDNNNKFGGSWSSSFTINGNTLTNVGHNTLTIPGDTVTFSFKSDGSGFGKGYGYYAIIKGIETVFSFGENPTKEGQVFNGWYKDKGEQGEKWDEYVDIVDSDITLYAHWKDPEAILLPGKELNCKLKNLANNQNSSSCYNSSDLTIKNIVRAKTLPSGINTIEIQSDDSNLPIYAWNKKGTIYIYADTDKIYLNPDSSYMFSYMQGLTSLDAKNFDTSKVNNMDYMFNYAQGLRNLNLSGRNTSNVTTMNNLFYYATSLESLNLNGRDIRNTTSVSNMFYYLYALETLSLREWKIPESMYNGFYNSFSLQYSYGLTTIDVSNWDLSSTNSLYELFYQLYSLETIIGLDTWNTSTVTNMSQMFQSCYSLETLDLSKWNVENVTNMSSMFQNAKGLEELNLGGWDTKNVNNMGTMFNNCISLKKINMDNWSFYSIPISEYNGSSYNGTTITGYNVSNMGGMFSSCNSLEKISARGWKIPKGFTHMLGCRNTSLCTSTLQEIDVSNWNLSVTKSLNGLFADSKVRIIKGLETWDTSNIQDMTQMFYQCYNLSTFDVSKFNTSGAYLMGQMFNNCQALTYLDLSHFDTRNVFDMNNMFAGDYNLTGLVLNGWNVRNTVSMGSMFYGANGLKKLSLKGWLIPEKFQHMMGCRSTQLCTSLDELDVSNWNLSITTDVYGLFGSSNAKEIKGLETWDTSNITGMNNMFGSMSNIIKLDLSNFDTRNVLDMEYMFTESHSLKELDLSNFDTRNVTTMKEMFKNATNLEKIYVGENDFSTGNVTNSTDMFKGAVSLVGGNGTVFDESKIDIEYARIDKEGQSGYLTNVIDRKYEIKYNLNNGVFSGEAIRNYTIRDSFSLSQVIRTGYIFKGWTGSNGNTPEKEVLINGKKGDLTFTANWEKKVEPSGRSGGGGGGSNKSEKEIENKVEDQEHNVAEENQEQQEQDIKQETKTPETIKGTTNSSSVDSEVQSAYKWAYKYKVTTMPTLQEAMPDRTVKRGHLAKMVVNYVTNVLGYTIPEKIPSECKWRDRKKDWESQEIKDYAVKACALGLMGIDMPKFLPNKDVTRAEFGTIMSRILWGKKYDGGTPYYKNHLNSLKENNIMTQIENPEKRTELRQWVWLMLMRSAENK